MIIMTVSPHLDPRQRIRSHFHARFTRVPVKLEMISDLVWLILSGRLLWECRQCQKRLKVAFSKVHPVLKPLLSEGTLVSVVIPTRNEAETLPLLLSSLIRQPYRDLEIIVVDYDSTDQTREIATRLGAKVVRVETEGIGYASHVGVSESNGDIIVRTDADAIFPPRLIPTMLASFKTMMGMKIYHVAHLYYYANFLGNLMAHLYDKYWRKPWATTGHFIAFTREAYDDIQGFCVHKSVDEDFDFGQRAFKKFGPDAIRFDFNNTVLVSSRRLKRAGGLVNYVVNHVSTPWKPPS